MHGNEVDIMYFKGLACALKEDEKLIQMGHNYCSYH